MGGQQREPFGQSAFELQPPSSIVGLEGAGAPDAPNVATRIATTTAAHDNFFIEPLLALGVAKTRVSIVDATEHVARIKNAVARACEKFSGPY